MKVFCHFEDREEIRGLSGFFRVFLSTFGLVLELVSGVDEVRLVGVLVQFDGLVLVLRVFLSTFGLVLILVARLLPVIGLVAVELSGLVEVPVIGLGLLLVCKIFSIIKTPLIKLQLPIHSDLFLVVWKFPSLLASREL